MNYLDFVVSAQKFGQARGITSICSANPFVLEAAILHGREHGVPVLIEATCNQVNQFGGYTGMMPDSKGAGEHKPPGPQKSNSSIPKGD